MDIKKIESKETTRKGKVLAIHDGGYPFCAYITDKDIKIYRINYDEVDDYEHGKEMLVLTIKMSSVLKYFIGKDRRSFKEKFPDNFNQYAKNYAKRNKVSLTKAKEVLSKGSGNWWNKTNSLLIVMKNKDCYFMNMNVYRFKLKDDIKKYYAHIDGSSPGVYSWAIGDKYLYAFVYGSCIPLDSGIYQNDPYQWLWREKKGREKKYLFKKKIFSSY